MGLWEAYINELCQFFRVNSICHRDDPSALCFGRFLPVVAFRFRLAFGSGILGASDYRIRETFPENGVILMGRTH